MMVDKKIVGPLEYQFDALNKKITFVPQLGLKHQDILMAVNLSFKNTVIYNFADTSKSGVFETNVLTLDYDTKAMNNKDNLMIFVYRPYETENLLNKLIGIVKEQTEILTEFIKTQDDNRS